MACFTRDSSRSDEKRRYFNVNVMSAVRLSRHYLPRMLKANKNGRILLIASEAGWRPIPTMIHYSTTKTAMIGLARGLAELTKGTTVTVNSVLAGPTWTEGVEEYLRGLHRSGLGADGKVRFAPRARALFCAPRRGSR
jgi:short-subunit dehydrogenase